MINNFYSYVKYFWKQKTFFLLKIKHCDQSCVSYTLDAQWPRCRESGVNRVRNARTRYALFAAGTIRRRRQNRSNFRKIAMSRRNVRAKELRRTMTGAMGRCARGWWPSLSSPPPPPVSLSHFVALNRPPFLRARSAKRMKRRRRKTERHRNSHPGYPPKWCSAIAAAT